MSQNDKCSLADALDDQGRLRVTLIPMPTGNDPWRTQGDYRAEQRRDTSRFRITIATLIVSMIGTAATALVAIWTVLSYAP